MVDILECRGETKRIKQLYVHTEHTLKDHYLCRQVLSCQCLSEQLSVHQIPPENKDNTVKLEREKEKYNG